PDLRFPRFGTVHTTEVMQPASGTGEQGLALGTWFWHVRAYDRAGNVGAWSAVASFTIGAASTPAAVYFADTYPHGVVGGSSAVGVVHLDNPATAGGQTVTLTMRYNKNTGFLAPKVPIPVTIPASVTLPAGAVSAQFDIGTSPVSRTVAVDILASINGLG